MKKRFSGPQIVAKLRQADVLIGQGKAVPEVCKEIEISQQTYYRWRQKYGGMSPDMIKQHRELQKENARLKRVVADQAVMPDDFSEVQILCTVGSCQIGAISGIIKPASQQEAIETADRYLRLLRRLYSDWPARNDPNGQIVTLRKSPYVIQVMRFQMPLEVRVNLKFDRDAAENAAWTAVLKRESERYQVEARRRLVEDAASKGLK